MSHIEHKTNLPKIAIIGRPNVGKSSLFNRILKQRKAIVESVPGVTRDRLYATVNFHKQSCVIIDTGGIMSKPQEPMEKLIYKQSREAIEEADAVILVSDIKSGLTYQDQHIADILKKRNEKTFLVVNKVDDEQQGNDAFDFYRLGLDRPYAISVLHGTGMSRLYADIVAYIIEYNKTIKKRSLAADKIKYEQTRVAVIGKPNVGKSSFINCLLDKERLLVDDVPGTTRDSVDITIKRDNEILVIVDTAGMRHKKKIKDVVEIFSLSRTKEALKGADTALIMIDAVKGLCREDIAVLDYAIKKGRACTLLVNKWDLIRDTDTQTYKERLVFLYRPIEWMQVLFTSCIQKRNIIKALDTACELKKKSQILISTPRINKFFERVQKHSPHVAQKSARPKVFYATQTNTGPPQFTLFCTSPKLMKREYIRFIERQFRKEFGFEGIPISFQLRARNKEKV